MHGHSTSIMSVGTSLTVWNFPRPALIVPCHESYAHVQVAAEGTEKSMVQCIVACSIGGKQLLAIGSEVGMQVGWVARLGGGGQ